MKAFQADARRVAVVTGATPSSSLTALVFRDFGLQALAAYRLGRWLLLAGSRPVWWVVLPLGWVVYFIGSRYARLAYGIRLDLSADIGAGLFIGHFGGIYLRRCRLGANCTISESTLIGPEGEDPAGPWIGDQVWIGGHVQIRGAIRIGEGCTISSVAKVFRDIPDHSLVMGSPARVVMRGYDNSPILQLPAVG